MLLSFFIAFVVFSVLHPVMGVEPANITIGGIFVTTDYSGNMRGSWSEGRTAMRVALHEINNDPNTLPNTKLLMASRNTLSASESFQAAVDLSVKKDDGFPVTAAIVGPAYSSHAVVTGMVADAYNVPQISPTATSVSLSDSVAYPYTLRVVMSDDFLARVMANVISAFNWPFVCTVADSSTFGRTGIDEFRRAAGELGIHVRVSVYFSDADGEAVDDMEQLKHHSCQVIVVYTVNVRGLIKLLPTFDSLQLLNNETVLVMSEAFTYQFLGGEISMEDAERLSGFIGVVPSTGFTGTPEYNRFLNSWRQLVRTDDPTLDNIWYDNGDMMPTTLGTFCAYDATWAIARAMDSAIRAGDDPRLGINVLKHLAPLSFAGVTGTIEFDRSLNRANGMFKVINGYVEQGVNRGSDIGIDFGNTSAAASLVLDKSIIKFRDGTNRIPTVDPEALACTIGFQNIDGLCEPCAPGFFNDGTSLSCTTCQEGTFSGKDGTSCVYCPENSMSSRGAASISDCLCANSFYKQTVDVTNSSNGNSESFSCFPCPAGCFCLGGEFSLVAPGFFSTFTSDIPCHQRLTPTTLAIAFRLFNMKWTPGLRDAMVFLDFVNLSPDVGTAECASVPKIVIWGLGFAMPIFLVIPVAIVSAVRHAFQVC
eukprot:TRINITY_DN2697_c0_g1_i3.p1 TRINITY_DN2697_c0_g1~~TRINITY_DN2697_c0_g1_i3.p1  ORF type:complete len:660 (-),score=-72.81 TRINITY_DN2697_c0_g1_i3:60-2009(-)